MTRLKINKYMDNTNKSTIFLVEDNLDIREIYRLRFEVAGFNVETSENGLDCISRITEVKPNIILLDIMMPEMDGFDVLQAIRKNFEDNKVKSVPVIIWSNLSQDEDIQKALNLGANEYLRKSDFEGDDLVAKVLEIWEKVKGR
jgi:CheY-like chemotaxis protein